MMCHLAILLSLLLPSPLPPSPFIQGIEQALRKGPQLQQRAQQAPGGLGLGLGQQQGELQLGTMYRGTPLWWTPIRPNILSNISSALFWG